MDVVAARAALHGSAWPIGPRNRRTPVSEHTPWTCECKAVVENPGEPGAKPYMEWCPLHAAAPELLAACKQVRADADIAELLTRPISPANLPAAMGTIRAYCDRLREMAEAAIAKADPPTAREPTR